MSCPKEKCRYACGTCGYCECQCICKRRERDAMREILKKQIARNGKTAAPSSDVRALFNKGLGVQKGNRFSFAFETEYEANRAFHYISELGELETSKTPASPPAPVDNALTVPKGHFWRGEINRFYCRNCGDHYDNHMHTDDASYCPASTKEATPTKSCRHRWDLIGTFGDPRPDQPCKYCGTTWGDARALATKGAAQGE